MPAVRINGRTYEEIAVTTRTGAPLPVFTGLEIPAHDYIAVLPFFIPAVLIYAVDVLHLVADLFLFTYPLVVDAGVVYKDGGAGGTTVATLTLAYDGSNNLTSVTKS